MSEGMMKLIIDMAVVFTNAKNRMPKDVHELREWLREFAEVETKHAEKAMEIYEEHLGMCSRPIVLLADAQPGASEDTKRLDWFGQNGSTSWFS